VTVVIISEDRKFRRNEFVKNGVTPYYLITRYLIRAQKTASTSDCFEMCVPFINVVNLHR
jgi:hypothetical protein